MLPLPCWDVVVVQIWASVTTHDFTQNGGFIWFNRKLFPIRWVDQQESSMWLYVNILYIHVYVYIYCIIYIIMIMFLIIIDTVHTRVAPLPIDFEKNNPEGLKMLIITVFTKLVKDCSQQEPPECTGRCRNMSCLLKGAGYWNHFHRHSWTIDNPLIHGTSIQFLLVSRKSRVYVFEIVVEKIGNEQRDM